jgi:hypothetical protein
MRSSLAALLLVPALLTPHVAQAGSRARAQTPVTRQPAQAPRPRAAAPEPSEVQAPPAAAAPGSFDANETREQLTTLLRQYPPTVADVLRLDPSLLTTDHYLTTYPALAAFLAQHPEVAHNPAYFVGTAQSRGWEDQTPQIQAIRAWQDMVQGLQIITVVGIVTFAFTWLLRTLLDYRRWLRVTRVQADVHGKLLDRFASNEDLLAYIQTPAGRKFLESAPIPLDAEVSRTVSAPINRILWSVQAGVVIAAGSIGLLYISGREIEEIGRPLFAMGSVGLALGAGFVVSALVSYVLSRRLGLVADRPAPAPVDMRGAS